MPHPHRVGARPGGPQRSRSRRDPAEAVPAQRSDGGPATAAGKGQGGHMTTVLVAEDDPDICSLITFKLRQSGYEVLAYQDGRSALDAIRKELPDVVLLDVMMPGMSGIEVCQILRKDPVTSGLRIIFLTARAQETDVKRGIEA